MLIQSSNLEKADTLRQCCTVECDRLSVLHQVGQLAAQQADSDPLQSIFDCSCPTRQAFNNDGQICWVHCLIGGGSHPVACQESAFTTEGHVQLLRLPADHVLKHQVRL